MNLWEIETSCWAKGYHLACGVDEAGAGPLAGPVYAAAVILPPHLELKWLNDSKQVTPKRREILFYEIQSQAIAWAVTAVDETVIDEVNILNARLMAMERAICQLEPAADYALIDGNRDKGITLPHETVIKGDSKSASIAAASILAKVSRDHYMEEMAEQYPQYQFDKHKGYPTKLHYELLDRFGPSPIHRKSFLKKWEERQ
jgi:Ribonuclease HII